MTISDQQFGDFFKTVRKHSNDAKLGLQFGAVAVKGQKALTSLVQNS